MNSLWLWKMRHYFCLRRISSSPDSMTHSLCGGFTVRALLFGFGYSRNTPIAGERNLYTGWWFGLWPNFKAAASFSLLKEFHRKTFEWDGQKLVKV